MKLTVLCLLYVWIHLLNACVLPPTDSSGKSQISVQTFGDMKYINIKQLYNIPDSTNFLVFKLQACADGFISLSTYSSREDGPFYEIIIGGWGNSKSVISKSKPYRRVTHKGVLLNCNSYKPFWVNWVAGKIKLGRGAVPGKDTIMQFTDQKWNVTGNIDYIGVTSHWKNKAHWIFNLAYKNGTATSETNCSTTVKEKVNSWCWPVNPCHNNGKCLANETTYNCYCSEKSETYGAHCEKQFLHCQLNPCQNGGRCEYHPSGHSACACGHGFKGAVCNIAKQVKPHWKEVFTNYHNWNGVYYFSNQQITFSLSINKLVYGPQHMLLATFKDNDAEIEMRGFSLDDVYVTFELSSVSKVGSKLNPSSDFVLSGLLINDHQSDGWEYKGKITTPENNLFGAFMLYTPSSKNTTSVPTQKQKYKQNPVKKDKDQQINLKIGLGVGLGILFASGMVLGLAVFLRSGCRKNISTNSHVIDYNRMEEPHGTTLIEKY